MLLNAKKKKTFTGENKAVNVTSMTDFKQNKLHPIKKIMELSKSSITVKKSQLINTY
jgi:hypothetical protein